MPLLVENHCGQDYQEYSLSTSDNIYGIDDPRVEILKFGGKWELCTSHGWVDFFNTTRLHSNMRFLNFTALRSNRSVFSVEVMQAIPENITTMELSIMYKEWDVRNGELVELIQQNLPSTLNQMRGLTTLIIHCPVSMFVLDRANQQRQLRNFLEQLKTLTASTPSLRSVYICGDRVTPEMNRLFHEHASTIAEKIFRSISFATVKECRLYFSNAAKDELLVRSTPLINDLSAICCLPALVEKFGGIESLTCAVLCYAGIVSPQHEKHPLLKDKVTSPSIPETKRLIREHSLFKSFMEKARSADEQHRHDMRWGLVIS